MAGDMNGTKEENVQNSEQQSAQGLTKGFNSFAIVVLCFAVFLFLTLSLSIYYRKFLERRRRPPFNAPSCLNCLFPRPVNYEQEMAILCAKYIEN